MNLNDLFEKQEALDAHILEEHPIQEGENRILKKVNALNCELWECSNQARFFKFWSNTQSPKNRSHLLEEYIDVLHFTISLALEFGRTEHEYEAPREMDLNKLVNGISNMITRLPVSRDIHDLLDHIIAFGYKLGFTEADVFEAYDKKNAENHDRQLSNY